MTQIRLNFNESTTYPGCTFTNGFELLGLQGNSVYKVGDFGGTDVVFRVEDNEQVIGIKALTVRDPSDINHGSLYNLQLKIAII